MKEWERLVDLLDKYRLRGGKDKFIWILDKSGQYTTRSMYRRLAFRGVTNRKMIKLWKSKLPYKLKVFMWLAIQDRLQTGVNLKKKEWKGSKKCCLCGEAGTMDHIFFHCHITRIIWACFKEALGWDRCPLSMQDILGNWIVLGGKDYHVKLFLFTSIVWGFMEFQE